MPMLRVLASFISVFCMILACSNDTGDSGGGAIMNEAGAGAGRGASMDDWTPRTRLIDALQVNVYTPTFERFERASLALRDAAIDWDIEPSAPNLETLQNAWKTAMADWQRAELMQIGPAGAVERRVGGMDYRDRIYSYPVTNSCRVDQELVRGAFTESGWVEGAQFNVRGLDAIEYLIFGMGTENSCPVVSGINRNGEWAALQSTPDEFQSRRSTYVRILTEALVSDAQALTAAWENTEGTFAHAFVNSSEPFASEKDVLDQVFAGLFYTDKFIKDLKLGKPAGITDDCPSEICPESAESKWSSSSKDNLAANLLGFKMIFFGGEDEAAYGFDDLLTEEGADALAIRISQNIEIAIEAIDGIDVSVEAQLAIDVDAIHSAHQAIRSITDDLKSQFVTVLNLSLPQEGAGDND
jgi:predicted lipoprotein